MSQTRAVVGTAIIDRGILAAMRRLWEGDLHPGILREIEIGIRAMLTSRVLTLSRATGVWDSWVKDPTRDLIWGSDVRAVEPPFGDHILDYEFTSPNAGHPFTPIPAEESDCLVKFVTGEVERAASRILSNKALKLKV